jgi:DNA processing protein
MNTNPVYKVALSLIPNVGPILARKLVAYVGSVEGVFKEKKSLLEKVPGIGKSKINGFDLKDILEKAEAELNYIETNNIQHIFYLDEEFPIRLKECDDAPIVLFYKGTNCFNAEKIISIVGTRRSTSYGDEVCKKLVEDLAILFPDLIVVSGFAYGIDICAHKAALQSNLNTVAVFGHGVQQVYPTVHSKYVARVLENGALVSEFPSQKKPDPGNFVSRNRIIAGLADATIVVESGEKGGSLLTADMALSYNRDVFAFPGRASDTLSKGCNNLIKKNSAALIESASDLIYYLKWDPSVKAKPKQQSLFQSLTVEEEAIIQILKQQSQVAIDQLSRILNQPVYKLSSLLLKLEFDGLIVTLPGKNYKLK